MEAADDTFLKGIGLERIHMEYRVLFSLRDNEKVFMSVVRCIQGWGFKDQAKLMPNTVLFVRL